MKRFVPAFVGIVIAAAVVSLSPGPLRTAATPALPKLETRFFISGNVPPDAWVCWSQDNLHCKRLQDIWPNAKFGYVPPDLPDSTSLPPNPSRPAPRFLPGLVATLSAQEAGTIGSPTQYDDAVLTDWVQETAKPATAPTLTVEERQAIQILAQRIELAQLRAQAAQSDFDKARGELTGLLQSLHKDGFDLNLQTMEYTKKPEPQKAPEKKKDGSQ